MSEIRRGMSLEEVATVVCTALDRHGIRAVLSGGSVVSIYTDNAYESKDLDFIVEGIAKKVAPAMEELGFRKEPGRYWTHPATEYWVEFPPGPLKVGDASVVRVEERRTKRGILRLLPPTECVMDRLAAFYHWHDPQALEQAVLVASRHEVDLEQIARWSRAEGAARKHKRFTELLER